MNAQLASRGQLPEAQLTAAWIRGSPNNGTNQAVLDPVQGEPLAADQAAFRLPWGRNVANALGQIAVPRVIQDQLDRAGVVRIDQQREQLRAAQCPKIGGADGSQVFLQTGALSEQAEIVDASLVVHELTQHGVPGRMVETLRARG